MLDADLAGIYGVATKVLNQAVKRNRSKFPADFMFQLTHDEVVGLRRLRPQSATPDNRSQIVTGSQKHRDPRFLPYAFTEHGAIMAANVLNSPRAVQMSSCCSSLCANAWSAQPHTRLDSEVGRAGKGTQGAAGRS